MLSSLCVQECFLVSGHEATMGLGGLVGAAAARDAPIVARLRQMVGPPITGHPFGNICTLLV